MTSFRDRLLAHYTFADLSDVGRDSGAGSSDEPESRGTQAAALTAALSAGTAEAGESFAVTLHGGGRNGDEGRDPEVGEVNRRRRRQETKSRMKRRNGGARIPRFAF